MTVQRAAYYAHGDVRIEGASDEVPVPGEGDVVLRVAFVGLCGTDLHLVHGNMDHRVSPPQAFGHEMSGVVESIGAGVEACAPGDRVVVRPLISCGDCPACLAGNSHICQHLTFVGIDSPGALQEYWTVPAGLIHCVSASVPLQHAALVEPLAVACHDARRGDVREGEKVAILGAGPIGLLIALAVRASGAEAVLIDIVEGRRMKAASLGFTSVGAEAAADHVEQWTGGAGADVVFEVTGSEAGAAMATTLPRVRGRIVIVGIHPAPRPFDLQRVFWRELEIKGARVYEEADYSEAIRMLEEGLIPADEIITSVRPLAGVMESLIELEAGLGVKALIDVGGGLQ
jgi:(R,R)-butanediol dehydrogenase/meso-butanediol dehydrogenase/diacetyl reductase